MLAVLLFNLGSFVYMDLKTLKFDLKSSHEASEIFHSILLQFFKDQEVLAILGWFFWCLRKFYCVELIFLLR